MMEKERKKIIKRLNDEGIYLEESKLYNEINGIQRVIRLIDDKECEKLQEFDVCKEMMEVIALDCLELLNYPTSSSPKELIENKNLLVKYLKDKNCTEQSIQIKGIRKKRIDFLQLYIKYLDFIKSDNIMEQRAIEEFGVKQVSYDPDVALLSVYIYCELFRKKDSFIKFDIKEYGNYEYEICPCDEKSVRYRGDTMTSWWTPLKAFLKINKERKKYFSDKESCKSFREMGKDNNSTEEVYIAVRKFMKVVYTIGNFCPVPVGFNEARSGGGFYDYWDLTLMKIREWYISTDNKSIYERDKLIYEDLLHNKGNSLACLRWLESFGQGRRGWHNFVDTLYMQDYVKSEDKAGDNKVSKDDDKYYEVIPFWKGHGWRENESVEFPTEEDKIKEAFNNMANMISARSKRIAEALIGVEKTP